MNGAQPHAVKLLTISILIVALTVACSGTTPQLPLGADPVAMTFTSFYEQLGGQPVLGYAISPEFLRGDVHYQYTVNSLMIYNPLATPEQRYTLAAIGNEFDFEYLPEPPPEDASIPYSNSHRIWDEVWQYYEQYGASILGQPLTGIVFNQDEQRYEQYFENVGFFRNLSDSPGMIHLMPYGMWMCGNACEYRELEASPAQATPSASVSLDSIQQVFLSVAERIGFDFAGSPLGTPRLAGDGFYEMVFENVVVYLDPVNPYPVRLRPLPEWLDIRPEPPVQNVNQVLAYFYQVNELGQGYNIPLIFLDYLTGHGSLELSGPPITELHPSVNGGYYQCFANMCLEYFPNAPDALRVRPISLGSQYLQRMSDIQGEATQEDAAIELQVWEQFPLLSPGQMQEIGIAVSQGGRPLSGVEFNLTEFLPDGRELQFYVPPTNADGLTTVGVGEIYAPNGAVVTYKVCIIGLVSPTVCVSEGFMIWDNP